MLLQLCYVSDDILIKFGKRIQELRKAKGWSQEELANQANFHRTYIGFIERGERNITIKALENLAKTFDISLSELLNHL